MLVLSRKVGEKIVIDDRVTITINRISGQRVSLGIIAPPGVRVVRSELPPLDVPAAVESPLPPTFPHPSASPSHSGT